MKRLVYIITVLTVLWQALPALAVTDKEMEQARVIAAQTYLRYANDGSGYLDALHPSTMAELEKNLKPKEKENIKAFKAIPVPSGYASWDKQKLVDYWSVTAFSNTSLTAKGKIGKNPARKKLNAMKVSAPASETKPAETKPADKKPAETKPATQPKEPDTKPAADASKASGTAAIALPTTQAAIDSAQAELDESRALAEAALDADDDPMIKKESNHTWIYVVVLCILVAVVVVLVVFASNVMKKSAGAPDQWHAASDEAKSLSRKLKEATTRLEESERNNANLQRKIDALTAEITRLRGSQSQHQQLQKAQQPPIQGIPRPQPKQETPVQQPDANPIPKTTPASNPQSNLRTIYLGRANAKGIFVRADRNFNPGNSVFRLDTSDGIVGTFKVVSEPTVIERVSINPAETLGASCTGPALAATTGIQAIVTDSGGTALFDGGCWKVTRKAKIHYE